MTNRKVAASRHTSVPKAVRAMQCDVDLMIFPEGVWNKSPNALILDLWPGIYRIACETGARVVPVVHYIRDTTSRTKPNPIHTVIDDPIQIDDLSEKAALSLVRDTMATWFYLMMELYGKATREETLKGYTSTTEAWEDELIARINTVDRYDLEIELCADYRPKTKVTPQSVWQSIADIQHVTPLNAAHVAYAQQLVNMFRNEDFQHRF